MAGIKKPESALPVVNKFISDSSEQDINNAYDIRIDPDWKRLTIPELRMKFNEENFRVHPYGAEITYKICNGTWHSRSTRNSEEVVVAVLQMVFAYNDLETLRRASSILFDLSLSIEGLYTIYKSGGVPAILKLLSSRDKFTSIRGVAALTNLLSYEVEAQFAVLQDAGVQQIVSLLQRDDEAYLIDVMDCLHSTVLENEKCKRILLACGGHFELMRIQRAHTNEKLLSRTSDILELITNLEEDKTVVNGDRPCEYIVAVRAMGFDAFC